MNAPVIHFKDTEKAYGRFKALAGLNLTVHGGEVLGLLGHNGAGKTTAIKLILGLLRPTRGQVRLFGEDPAGRSGKTLRKRVGYLPENVSLYDQLSAREVLNYLARLKGAATGEVDALLDELGLMDAAERRVKTYSKGMRQRLGLAQALLARPQLLLLDEPTVGLDPLATQGFYAIVDRLREAGTTVILCSHVLPGIEGHVDRVAILGHGRLLALGTAQQLREASGLAVTFRVRGRWAPGTWDAFLADEGIEHYTVNGTALELSSAASEKMHMMRVLLAQPGVEDIEVIPASLQRLYLHLSERQANEGDAT